MPPRTVCTKGLHDLTDPDNVILKPDGSRQCRPCQRTARRAGYRRQRDGLPTLYGRLPPGQATCAVETCDRPRRRAGTSGRAIYCVGHYGRVNRYGEPFEDVPLGAFPAVPLPEARARMTAGSLYQGT